MDLSIFIGEKIYKLEGTVHTVKLPHWHINEIYKKFICVDHRLNIPIFKKSALISAIYDPNLFS